MKIKTIIYPIEQSELFDKVVNAKLSRGWELKKRGVTNIQGEPNEVGSTSIVQCLYAELEKE